jgi:hypothetical protein
MRTSFRRVGGPTLTAQLPQAQPREFARRCPGIRACSKTAAGEDVLGRRPQFGAERTFAQFSKTLFEQYVVANNKPSEQVTKRYVLSGSLVPFFGTMPVVQIGAHDIERYKAAQIRSGVWRKTVNNRLTILRKCLHTAYDWVSLSSAPPTRREVDRERVKSIDEPIARLGTRRRGHSSIRHRTAWPRCNSRCRE